MFVLQKFAAMVKKLNRHLHLMIKTGEDENDTYWISPYSANIYPCSKNKED